jgi:hypothetical protein
MTIELRGPRAERGAASSSSSNPPAHPKFLREFISCHRYNPFARSRNHEFEREPDGLVSPECERESDSSAFLDFDRVTQIDMRREQAEPIGIEGAGWDFSVRPARI